MTTSPISNNLQNVLQNIITDMNNKEDINKYKKELERLHKLINELSMENEKLQKIDKVIRSDSRTNAKLKSYADQIEEVYNDKIKADLEINRLTEKADILNDIIINLKREEKNLQNKIQEYKDIIEQQKHDLDELRQFDLKQKEKKISLKNIILSIILPSK
jgi:predicted RNase H-like nuclease (RuvC/YqgF family)